MADHEYIHGKMDIKAQTGMWEGFLKASVWGSGIIILIVAYATLTLTMPVNWMVALVLCAGLGIVGGLLMNMGSAWVVTVIGMSVLAVIIQVTITLFNLFL